MPLFDKYLKKKIEDWNSETKFQKAYREMATKMGLSLDPDDLKHFYDYRALYKETGELEPDETGHFPSKYKLEGHPNMIVDGINTKTGEAVSGGGGGAGVIETEPYKPINFDEYLTAPSTEEMNQSQDALLAFEKDYDEVSSAIDVNYELYKKYTKELDDLEVELQEAPDEMQYSLNQKYNNIREQHNVLVENLQKDTKRQKEIYEEYTKVRATYDKDIEIYNRWAKAQNEKPPSIDTTLIAQQLKNKTYISGMAEEIKRGNTFAGVVATFGMMLTKIPKQVASSALQAAQGKEGATVVNRDWADEYIESARKDIEGFVKQAKSKYGDKSFMGLKISDLAELPQNMGYSLTSMGAGVAVGVPLAFVPLPGFRAAAYVAGTVAAGKVAYNATTYQIMQQYLELKNEESITNTGEGITQEEEDKFKKEFDKLAHQHGLWEAIPEAISNLTFISLLTAPLTKMIGKSLAGQLVSRISGMYGMELATEMLTQMGQANIELKAGMREGKPRSWTSPKDWITSLKEVAPQTFLLTTLMAGAGGTIISGKEAFFKAKNSLKNEIGEEHRFYNKLLKSIEIQLKDLGFMPEAEIEALAYEAKEIPKQGNIYEGEGEIYQRTSSPERILILKDGELFVQKKIDDTTWGSVIPADMEGKTVEQILQEGKWKPRESFKVEPKAPTIPKELEPLAEEAKKAKDVNDFIDTISQEHLMDLSDPTKHRWGRAIPQSADEAVDTIASIEEKPKGYLEDIRLSTPETYSAIMGSDKNITIYRAVPPTKEQIISFFENQLKIVLKYGNRKTYPFADTLGLSNSSDYYNFLDNELQKIKSGESKYVGILESKLDIGDYVALDKNYVKMHGESVLVGQQKYPTYKIISKTVPKTDVIWGQADFNEWVYSPQKLRDKVGNLTDFYNQAIAKPTEKVEVSEKYKPETEFWEDMESLAVIAKSREDLIRKIYGYYLDKEYKTLAPITEDVSEGRPEVEEVAALAQDQAYNEIEKKYGSLENFIKEVKLKVVKKPKVEPKAPESIFKQELREIPIEQIELATPTLKKKVKEYREQLKVTVTPPIEIIEPVKKGGKYSIIEGHHRIKALEQSGEKTIKAWVTLVDETGFPLTKKRKSLEVRLKEALAEIRKLKGILKTVKGNKEKRAEFKKKLVEYINKNMPFAIRNKMLATIKNVTGEKALAKAIEKIDEYTTTYYGKQYTNAIQSELKAKKIKPKRTKASMLKGRFTPEIQDKLDFIRANINESRGTALEKIQENINLFNKGEAINIAEENELLNMVGIKEMDLETLQSTLENIKSLKKEGKTQRGIREAKKREEHEKDIAKTIETVTGKEVEIDEETGKAKIDSSYKTLPKTKEMGWVKKTIDKIVNWQFGWDNLLDKLSVLDKTSKPYESELSKIGDNVHYARVANIKALEEVLNLIQLKFAEAFESTSVKEILKTTRKLREEIDLGTFKNSEGSSVHLVLNKEQILKKYMQLEDPTLEKTFDEGMLYTEEIEDAIRGAVSKKELAWVNATKEVYEYMWERINLIFEDMYGIHFPHNPNYSGTIRRDVDIDIPEASLIAQDAFKYASILNPSLKTRSKTKQSLKYDEMTASLMNYVMQMEHFINWAKPLNDLRSVFGDKRVKSVINELYGQDVLTKVNGFLDDMTRDGVDKAKIIKWVDTIRFNFTRSILAKPHIGLKQIPSVLAYMTEMPVQDFFNGIGNFWKNPIKNYRYLVAHSPYARARFGEGFERDIHGAMKSDYARLLSHTHKISDMTMGMVRAGDKFAVMQGMWAKFYSETKGQTTKAKNAEEAIRKAEIITQRTQPSFTIESLATGQRGGSLLKLFTMFQNQPNKYFRIIADNARNFKAGRGSRVKAASNIVLAWAVLPMLFQFIGDGGKWITRHQLRALVLGIFNDILVFGSMIRGMYGFLIKEGYDVEASPVFATLREIEYVLAKVAKWTNPDKDLTPEDVQAFCEHFAKAIGQLMGLPTPYGVQVTKAIQTGDYRQLLFSEYILELENKKPTEKKPYVKSGDKYGKYLKGKYKKPSKYGKYLKY